MHVKQVQMGMMQVRCSGKGLDLHQTEIAGEIQIVNKVACKSLVTDR